MAFNVYVCGPEVLCVCANKRDEMKHNEMRRNMREKCLHKRVAIGNELQKYEISPFSEVQEVTSGIYPL